MIPWFHFKCISDMFPFGKLYNQNFCPFSPGNKKNNTNTDSSINQKSPLNLRLLFNQLSDFFYQTQSTKILKKWPIVKMMILMTCEKLNLNRTFSLFILSSYMFSLQNFWWRRIFIKALNQKVHVIVLGESKIKSNMNIRTTLICLTFPLNTYQQSVMLEEPSYILVLT